MLNQPELGSPIRSPFSLPVKAEDPRAMEQARKAAGVEALAFCSVKGLP